MSPMSVSLAADSKKAVGLFGSLEKEQGGSRCW